MQLSTQNVLLHLGLLIAALVWAPLSQGQTRADYKITAGDIVALKSLNDPDGTGSFRVSRQGHIDHPYLESGTFRLAGLTPTQAARALENVLRGDYLINPRITVTVLAFAKTNFTVIGAVNNPGSFDERANQRLTLIQAIARAGDFKDVANRKKVVVRRMENGSVRPVIVNVKAMLEDPNRRPFYIQDGDTIEVKESLF